MRCAPRANAKTPPYTGPPDGRPTPTPPMPYRPRLPAADTIVAPATPPGDGGVGIVRLSGPQAEALLAAAFRGR